jgi:hypothetical protein
MKSRKNTARLAGLLYFLMSVQAPIALLYVPSHILVQNNPAATTANIVSHEFLFRLSIVSQLVSAVIFLYLAFVLHRLFKRQNSNQAGLLVAFVLAQVIITFVFETFNFAALRIANGDLLGSMPVGQKQNLVMLLIKIHGYGITIQEIFWGFWLLPFGLLVYKSGFIPQILGLCLIFGCACWVTDSISYLLFPDFHDVANPVIMKVSWIGEMPILFWLLIKGTNNNAPGLEA